MNDNQYARWPHSIFFWTDVYFSTTCESLYYCSCKYEIQQIPCKPYDIVCVFLNFSVCFSFGREIIIPYERDTWQVSERNLANYIHANAISSDSKEPLDRIIMAGQFFARFKSHEEHVVILSFLLVYTNCSLSSVSVIILLLLFLTE